MAATNILQRITTEYIETEDRIRLSGEVENAGTVVVWLSRRLLIRLLPVLLQWLETEMGNTLSAEVMQEFVQQAARAELEPQPPVRADAGCAGWLVSAVDIAHTPQAMSLTFRGDETQSATLTMAAKPLRQWLGIMHDTCVRAEWSLTFWPDWMGGSAGSPGLPERVVH